MVLNTSKLSGLLLLSVSSINGEQVFLPSSFQALLLAAQGDPACPGCPTYAAWVSEYTEHPPTKAYDLAKDFFNVLAWPDSPNAESQTAEIYEHLVDQVVGPARAAVVLDKTSSETTSPSWLVADSLTWDENHADKRKMGEQLDELENLFKTRFGSKNETMAKRLALLWSRLMAVGLDSWPEEKIFRGGKAVLAMANLLPKTFEEWKNEYVKPIHANIKDKESKLEVDMMFIDPSR
jgi:hypothetical protein